MLGRYGYAKSRKLNSVDVALICVRRKDMVRFVNWRCLFGEYKMLRRILPGNMKKPSLSG